MSSIVGGDIWIVGGAVRDLFLDRIQTSNIDIDITGPGHPSDIWSHIAVAKLSSDISIFHTEKYGTMTVVDHSDGLTTKYEFTPFRGETTYSDGRHPDQILWTNNLIEDSARRDFGIGAMYMTYYDIGGKNVGDQDIMISDIDIAKYKDDGYIAKANLLVISNHEILNQIMPDAKLDYKALSAYIAYISNKELLDYKNICIIADPQLGLADLFARKISCVGDPNKRFWEDHLRILRGLRFVCNLPGFDIASTTWKSMKKLYYLVRDISKERIHEEIMKVFAGPNPFAYISLMDELNILKYIFPSVASLKYISQPIRYHPRDVYTHSMLVLYDIQKRNSDPLVRLSCIFHDVGKAEQYYTHTWTETDEDRKLVYGGWLNHINCGADMAEQDLQKIGFSKSEIADIRWYVQNHMVPGEILMSKPSNQIKKLRKLISEADFDMLDNLIDISLADRAGQYNPIQSGELEAPLILKDLLEDMKVSEGRFTRSQMLIDGYQVMKLLNIGPSPEVGKILDDCREYILADLSRNSSSKLEKYIIKKFAEYKSIEKTE